MRLRVVASLTLLIAATALAAPLSKQAALKIMHERHEGMEAVGKANKVLRRELTAGSPNIAAIRSSANTIATMAARCAHWFPRGTGQEMGKTGAKPEIWLKPAEFSAQVREFQASSKVLQLAAARGDLAAARSSHERLRNSCKSCHDTYRSDMH